MCDPGTIALTALVAGGATKVAGAVVGHKAQNKEKKANDIAATDAAVADFSALHARELEEKVAAGQSLEEGARQAASASSMARLSAISSGVGGASADAIVGGIAADRGRFNDSVKQNLDMSLLQIQRQGLGVEATRKARINSKSKANPWVTGLAIGGAVADTATQYYAGKP